MMSSRVYSVYRHRKCHFTIINVSSLKSCLRMLKQKSNRNISKAIHFQRQTFVKPTRRINNANGDESLQSQDPRREAFQLKFRNQSDLFGVPIN